MSFNSQENIQALLEPIPGDSPGGKNLPNSGDPAADTAFTVFQKEMNARRPLSIKAKSHAPKGVEILKNHSKHLWVITRLALCWFAIEQLPGFRNGLLLLLGALKTYKNQLNPSDPKQRVQIIKYLNSEPFQNLLHNSKASEENRQILLEVQELINLVTAECRALFPDEKWEFPNLLQAISNKLGDSKSDSREHKKTSPPKTDANEQSKPQSTLPESPAPVDSKKTSVTETETDTIKEDKEKPPEKEPKAAGSAAVGASPDTPKYKIHRDVLNLLEDIDADSPTGIDISSSTKAEMMVIYGPLKSEMRKAMGRNYEKCIEWSQDILTEKSKHLRVAVWLTVSWFAREGLGGLKKGLILLIELLKKYKDQLHPQDVAQQLNILQSLNTEKRLKRIRTIRLGNEEERFQITDDTLRQLKTKEFLKTHHPKDVPQERRLKEIPFDVFQKLKNLKDREIIGEEAFREALQEQVFDRLKQISKEKALTSLCQTVITAAAKKARPDNEKIYYTITQPFLDFIASHNPAQIFKLTPASLKKLEAAKIAEDILENLKPLKGRVFKKQADYLNEINNALQSVVDDESIEQYKTQFLEHGRVDILKKLEPLKNQRILGRDSFWQRVRAVIENEQQAAQLRTAILNMSNQNIQDLLRFEKVYKQFLTEYERHFSEHKLKLKLDSLGQLIEERIHKAKKLLDDGRKALEKAIEEEKESLKQETAGAKKKTPGKKAGDETPGEETQKTGPITSPEDARNTIKNALLFYFDLENDQDVPTNPYIYGMSRSYRWSVIAPETIVFDKETMIARIEGPNQEKRKFISDLAKNNNTNKLIAKIESSFLDTDTNFHLWLDAQRLAAKALAEKGENGKAASEEIKVHLARLIRRIPALPNLIFSDQETPLANPETKKWIEEDVESAFGSGSAKIKEKIYPPIAEKDLAHISEFYEKACQELPQNFEENAKKMQDAITAETNKKGRLLWMINLSSYSYMAGRYDISRLFYRQTMDTIEEYGIIDWEQGKCLSVWRTAYLNSRRLLENGALDPNLKSTIEQEQNDLFYLIGKYDFKLALELKNDNKSKENDDARQTVN